MTDARTNYGTLLKIGDGEASESFTTLGEIVSLDPPELMNEVVEATNHSSGGWKEFISSGLKELGEFSMTINFTSADMATIYALVVAGTSGNYQILFPDDGATTWTFASIITSIKPAGADAQSPEALQAEIKFQPTGANTLA